MVELTHVLATTDEVCLKGKNRGWFERMLTANVRRAVADLPLASLTRPASRVLLEFARPVPFVEAARRLGTVFGLKSILPVRHAGRTLDDVRAAIGPELEQLPQGTFAVRCTRSDKSYELTSVDIEREIGRFVQDRTGRAVNLGRPDTVLHLLLDTNGFWCWAAGVPGPGGLPVGTGGRATALLSGGIDSPVAAWMMLKRGVELDFVHFHSVPASDPGSLQKAEELASILARYQGPCRLALVPLLPIQEQITELCPEVLRVLLYRRFMVRIAERLATDAASAALVTGESVGQVASQTLENMAAVEAVASRPVLRPLIGLDKQEIVDLARRIGTYDTSILPHDDCCSLFVPQHPETRARVKGLDHAESSLCVDTLVQQAIDTTEQVVIDEPAPWTAVPPPPGAQR